MRETEKQEKMFAVWCEDCENWVLELQSAKSIAEFAQEQHETEYDTYGHTTSIEEI